MNYSFVSNNTILGRAGSTFDQTGRENYLIEDNRTVLFLDEATTIRITSYLIFFYKFFK